MDIFTAVIIDDRSVVPDSTHTFSTLAKAKEFVESTVTSRKGTLWDEWEEGKFVFGYGGDGEVEEPIAAVYGSVLDETKPD